MSLRALRSLVAITRYGTFARAAEALGLTPSAVGLHVKALEEEFGVTLFDRSRRQPVLTAAGEIAVEHARGVLDGYDAIKDAVASGPGIAGRLRLGAIQTALAGVLPEALSRLQAAHPRLHIRVNSGMSAELAREIEAGNIDAAVTTEPVKPYPAGLHFDPTYCDRFWVVASPEHEGVDTRTLLTRLPLLRFDKRAWAGRIIEDELRRQGLRVREEMELDSQQALARMAATGLGVAVVPLDERDLESLPPLYRQPFGEPQLVRRVGVLSLEEAPAARFVALLVEALIAVSRP
ncbi:LysR family transcriptional regulator [Acuticoccus sediminis]|uniref:LysR family transcriptional regulator n=1 Tax=Acuticoccus sediminis TaxID=2184697 RepID=A0A8B2P1V3_9HYPH|nr:LysR family transcriptional regulator [Acuticoccus sediminis]RAI02257.1 LysR family transcriptional regulator [Acuticoccus sediminis]